MSTISDVAKRAGVSTMTVSRVIHHAGYVNQHTRERVEKAILELGYVPNALARSLRFKQTGTIALILTDITNPFFTTIARCVEDTASAQGFSVMFCNTDESEREEIEYINVLLQKQVDGVLLVPASVSTTSVDLLQHHSVPVVVLDRHIPEAQVDIVRCDSAQGAVLLTDHLLALGHRRIALLNGPAHISTSMDRVSGYHQVLSEAGLTGIVYNGDFTQPSGYQMAQAALGLSPRPTALFAANNFIAIGAYHAIRDAEMHIPEDISLVAFDDLPATFVLDPFLTAAAQPAYEMGRRAAELLLARLSGNGPSGPQEIVLPTELIIRKSSGPAPVCSPN